MPGNVSVERVERALAIGHGMFPATFKPAAPDLLRVSIGLLARCMTTGESCLHLAALDRRSDLMALARTLYEHTVTLAWLTGSPEGEQRMLLWQRYCDEHALRLDDEVARLGGGEPKIPEAIRQQIAEATAALGEAKMPGLADRAIVVDREWADRLGFDPQHRDDWSMRRLYSIAFRVGSSFAHPTLIGLRFVMDRRPDGTTIGFEPGGHVEEALLPVPALLVTALSVGAHAFGRPRMREIDAYLEWHARTRRDD